MASPALLSTHLTGFGEPRRGKVRELYDLGDALLMIATDRISAFDVVMSEGIPGKGILLNQLSAYWFRELAHIVDHHVISTDDGLISDRIGDHPELKGRAMLVRKAPTIPVECVARGYIAGSWWKPYSKGERVICGETLPDGLLESSRLPEPIFSPATKAEEGHDENISFDQMVNELGSELTIWLRDKTLEIYSAAAKMAEAKGLILADTKFEFGMTDNGPIWIDEALTPDSSRYWPADSYAPGGPQPSFDKQYLRDWLEGQPWNKQAPAPTLPSEVIHQTVNKYREAYERITGHDLDL